MERCTRYTREPFRGSLAVGLGAVTWDRLAGRDFVRLYPDVYVGAAAEIDVRTRVQALSVWSSGRGVVAGPLVALSYGVDCSWSDAEVVLDGPRRRPAEEVAIHKDRLFGPEVATRFGCPVTTPLRTAFDLARRTPLTEAVAVDALAHHTRFGATELGALADRHPRARGLAQVRTVLARMDPRAESLPETRLRIGLVDRGDASVSSSTDRTIAP